jgi:hypothetical protein
LALNNERRRFSFFVSGVGGGALRLMAQDTLILSGAISANGLAGAGLVVQ